MLSAKKITVTAELFRPHALLIITHLAAFLAWLFPSFDYFRKGFTNSLDLFSLGGLVLLNYLLLASLVTYIGYRLGKAKPSRHTTIDIREIASTRNYLLLNVIAFIGVAASLLTIMKSGGIGFLMSALSDGRANELKFSLYENYSAGILSLRYVSIYCGAFLIARRLSGEKLLTVDILSLALLATSSLISSRLTLIAAALGGIYLYIQCQRKISLKPIKTLTLICTIFIALSALNWTRNSNFYTNLGLNFYSGSLSEIITYLGSPFQAALYAATNLGNTFNYDQYHASATIESSLSTNSALVEMTMENGWPGIFYILSTLLVSSLAIGFLEKYRGGRYCFISIPLIYSTAEIWRIYLFNQGIVITLISVPLALIALDSPRKKRRPAYANPV